MANATVTTNAFAMSSVGQKHHVCWYVIFQQKKLLVVYFPQIFRQKKNKQESCRKLRENQLNCLVGKIRKKTVSNVMS